MTSKQSEMSVFGWTQGTGGTHWYRIAEPLRGLALRGHEVRTGPRLDDQVLDACDTVTVHMLNEDRASEGWMKLAERGSHRTVIDVDDDVWNFDPRTDTHRVWTPERLLRLQNNVAAADLVTTPSPYLAEILSGLNSNVAVLPNYVPAWLLNARSGFNPRQFTLGYQGARQHTVDLQSIATDVHTFLARHRKTRMRIYGELNPIGWPRVDRQPWQSDIPTYYRSLWMTIGLGPLADIPFNYGKSAVRAVEYAALGIPALLTDVPAYRPYVRNGWTGWLVPHGTPWNDRLEWAYKNREQLEQMSRLARRAAKDWTTERNAEKWEVAYRG